MFKINSLFLFNSIWIRFICWVIIGSKYLKFRLLITIKIDLTISFGLVKPLIKKELERNFQF